MLITDAYGSHGGISAYNRNVIEALAANKQVTEIVCIPLHIFEEIKDLPPKVTYIYDAANSKKNFVKAALKYKLSHSIRSFDMIICGLINLFPIAQLMKLGTCVPIYTIIHGTDAWTPTTNQMANKQIHKSDGFLYVSEFTKEKFIQWSNIDENKGIYWPNGIELNKFSPGPKPENLIHKYGLQDKKILFTLCRHAAAEQHKGVDEVIDLLPKVAEECTNVHYMIAGTGDDLPRLKQKVKDNDLSNNVTFAGRIAEEEKNEYYRLADAYVMPSRGEGFGIVFIEALATGCPVLASSIDGSQEAVMNGEVGIMVDPRNKINILEGIIQVLNTEKKDYPQIQKFSTRMFYQRVNEFVQSHR